jgi:predicted Abi (CAAX) family protease
MQHPSRNARERAAGLREALEARYGSIEPVYDSHVKEWVHQTGNDPSAERFREWVDMGKALIDAIHTTGDPAD